MISEESRTILVRPLAGRRSSSDLRRSGRMRRSTRSHRLPQHWTNHVTIASSSFCSRRSSNRRSSADQPAGCGRGGRLGRLTKSRTDHNSVSALAIHRLVLLYMRSLQRSRKKHIGQKVTEEERGKATVLGRENTQYGEESVYSRWVRFWASAQEVYPLRA